MAKFGAILSTSDMVPTVTQYVTPSTGDTVTVTAGVTALLINPAGTLVTLTVSLPSTPADGDQLTMSTSQAITTLTIANGTIIGTLTTLALAGFAAFQYNATAAKWFRIG